MPVKPKKRRRSGKDNELHTHLAICVKNYTADASGSINFEISNPIGLSDASDDPVYRFETRVEITGISKSPEERAGEAYEITIYGDDARSRGHDITLKDMQVRDEHGSPRYRSYRGKSLPIYDRPPSLGRLNKVRGELRWVGWLFAPSRFVRDVLVLLSCGRGMFVALHEHRIGRTRWIHGLSLQTNDPTEE